MSDGLKPCPFCGSQPHLWHAAPMHQNGWVVCCENTDCPVQPATPSRYRSAAAEAWNARFPDADLVEALEAVEWLPGTDILGGQGNYCPWCESEQDSGHEPNCQRQLVLARYRKEG